MSQPTCAERVEGEYTRTVSDLRILWELYCTGDEDGDEDLGRFEDYGLSFDYVAPGTFTDQDEGYFRYQLSWGGPSDEFRFYTGPEFYPHRIEYWFLDWFDGARWPVHGVDLRFLREIFDWFAEGETVQSVYDAAMVDWSPPTDNRQTCDECGDVIDFEDDDAGVGYGINQRALCGDCYRDEYPDEDDTD